MVTGVQSCALPILAAGETLEYTLVYVADEDQLDSLYLDIYPGYGNAEEGAAAPYVKVK